jgi:hypothetical protein
VVLAYAFLCPLACAGVSWVLARLLGSQYLHRMAADNPLPPAPSWSNVLFGAGPPEVAVACAVAGWYLWHVLWNVRLSPSDQAAGVRATFPALAGRGLLLGPVAALLIAMPIGILGLYLRMAPVNQPWFVRPFFAVLALIPMYFTSLLTGVVPLVVVLLGLLLGAGTALAVSFLWREFPEEPVHK